jgi:hypothetical protein
MPVNYEIKSQLARLLATENLVVENKKVPTACFDVETRVLTLPLWDKASSEVYDMLVAHEVGHALFTPNEWDWEDRVPRQFVNVTEDARIEKLMKRKYGGISKSFYRGYKELSEDDFFELSDRDLSKMNLADRVNLQFKIGHFVDIPFTDDEKEIIEMISECETFSDSVLAAEILHQKCKDQVDFDSNKDPDTSEQDNSQTSGDEQQNQNNDSEETEENGETNDIETKSEGESQTSNSSINDDLNVETDDLFNQGAQSLTSETASGISGYYEIPKINLDNVIISSTEIHSLINDWWKVTSDEHQLNSFSFVDKEYHDYKKSAQKEVNYLVKEFESKKAADAYFRSSVSKTGLLDCSKLHTYKYNEDLFKKVNVLPDGKNHGLIFILDWSGSMGDIMEDTIKQLFNIVWFCSKVNIPFEVYAFSNNFRHSIEGNLNVSERIENEFVIQDAFVLMNILTHKVNKKNLDEQMKTIWRLSYYFKKLCGYSIPSQLNLSGTPLNESLVVLHSLIPQFKSQNKLQKVQCVILTDGEAHPLKANVKRTCGDKDFMGCFYVMTHNSYLRNRNTGFTYNLGEQYWSFTQTLLLDLKQTFPDVNFIGFRIANSRDFGSIIRRYDGMISEDDYKKSRKNKSYVIKGNSGYQSYFVIMDNTLNQNVEFDVDDDASKAKIKSAFTKSLRSKALNKKVLSEFMDLVC